MNTPVRKKLIIGFSGAHALLGLVIILSAVILTMTSNKYDTVINTVERVGLYVAHARGYYYNELNALGEMSIAYTDDLEAERAKADKTMYATLAMVGESLATEEIKTAYAALDASLRSIDPDIRSIAALAASDPASAVAMYSSPEFVAKASATGKAFTGLLNQFIDYAQKRETSISGNKNKTIALIFALLAVSILLSTFGIVVPLSKSIRIPLAEMREAAEKLAYGDVDVEIVHHYNDEVGDLADAMIKMLETSKRQAGIAREISQGNLDLEVHAKAENDLLGNAIVDMVDNENRVMSGIRGAVYEIRTGSQEVAAASQSLAQGSTEQASAIEEITASLNDITERTKVNASDATKASKLVIEAKEDATDGNAKMKDMILAMTEINDASENISKIIKVIDDIAFQTNILALNAAVEAARAGQHGRGFAVVADEVRNLAGKSAAAASETAEMIEDSIAKVQKGSKLAEDTAAAFENIVEAIDKIVTITDSIAVASNDQASAITQIDQAIGQVSQVVQTNSATSEQCAAASEELSAQAGKLREMIARYKLRTVNGTAPAAAETGEKYEEPIGLPDDVAEGEPPVISLDDGFGKY